MNAERARIEGKLDDADFPAYTMGRAAEMVGTSQPFLRSLEDSGLLRPQRSAGGHRRYSRSQLRIAARARELVDQGMPVWGACRIILLEEQLAALGVEPPDERV